MLENKFSGVKMIRDQFVSLEQNNPALYEKIQQVGVGTELNFTDNWTITENAAGVATVVRNAAEKRREEVIQVWTEQCL